MKPDIFIEKQDEVYARVHCEPSTAMELRDYFTFKVPGYRFMPLFKLGAWDGNIRLFDFRNYRIYNGLYKKIQEFGLEHKYEVELSPDYSANVFSVVEAQEFVNKLNIPLKEHDFQIETFIYSVRNKRALFELPTASGKSLIIYLITKWYNTNTLIIVPTTSLIHQMEGDFKDYGNKELFHKIYEGQEKYNIEYVCVKLVNDVELFFLGNEYITLINNNRVMAKELKETDEISDQWIKEKGVNFIK